MIRETKRLILDALACAIGAFDAEPCRICREVAREHGGAGVATLIGERDKVSVSQAIIANETMIRYLDFNDVLYFPKSPGKIGGAHPSDALPAALAVGEREHASGKEVIAAVVAAYETIGRMVDATAEGITPMGFHHGSVMPFAGAVIAGRLIGLDAEQMTNAMGIGASAAIGLGINDAEGEEYNNTKNIADGLMAERGVFAAYLAQRGFTGPERIIEGNKGFAHSLLRGVENYIVKPLPNDYYLMRTKMKFFPTESTNQGHLAATTLLVTEHDLKPDDIAEVVLRMSKRTVVHNGDPVKKYPRNKEGADHSAYFMTALAIVTRRPCRPVVLQRCSLCRSGDSRPDREGEARARTRIRRHHAGGAGHNPHHRRPRAGEARRSSARHAREPDVGRRIARQVRRVCGRKDAVRSDRPGGGNLPRLGRARRYRRADAAASGSIPTFASRFGELIGSRGDRVRAKLDTGHDRQGQIMCAQELRKPIRR